MLYRRTASEMSAFVFEFEHAKQEGVEFRWLVKPLSIVGTDGRVAGLDCIRVTPELAPIEGSEFIVGCDMVIPAIGQLRRQALFEAMRGNEKIYAGGDLVNGGREVVDAVADGKRAALGIMGSVGSVSHG